VQAGDSDGGAAQFLHESPSQRSHRPSSDGPQRSDSAADRSRCTACTSAVCHSALADRRAAVSRVAAVP